MDSNHEAYFYAPEVNRLQELAQEAIRARPDSIESRFVAPEGDILDIIGSLFHHVLYGRRGSGKSSLLRKIEEVRRAKGHLVAWTDQEVFMELEYPDVLISTLSAVLAQFSEQIRSMSPTDERTIIKRFLRRKPLSAHVHIADELEQAAMRLEELKNEPTKSEIEWTSTVSIESSSTRGRSRKIQAGHNLISGSLGSNDTAMASQRSGSGISRRFTATKTTHLERAIPTYQKLMRRATSVAPDAFIILDDFYRLAAVDQPRVAGYLHRVVKDTHVWLKIGSIRYWTHLYSGRPPVGLQESHDIAVRSLDRALLAFKTSKLFLEQILSALAREAAVDVERLLSEGARDRLVLAAGGVPRDYLGLLGEAIRIARDRGDSKKSGTERVTAEDVNEAAGQTIKGKFNDLNEDAGDAGNDLRDLVISITRHCRNTQAAWFLVDFRDQNLMAEINKLENMRFVHEIAMSETVPDPGSSRYNIFLLDISQLVAQRAQHSVDFMGWAEREKRRSRNLVLRLGETDHEPRIDKISASNENEQLLLLDDSAIVPEIEVVVDDVTA